ncbi:MAG: 4'-phosphopantetheinyl transferase superfamily protein [Lachnospiraceae bacterium]|nr:4'-phosphopantetheinyl transferase superfamily protein [Lachnospiraceae bacterium]
MECVKEKDWRIFHRYITEDEYKMIETSGDPEACFFKVWTIREAFSKEEGKGLTILDDDFSVDHGDKKISYNGKTLCFKSFEHYADCAYSISICSPHEVDREYLQELSPEEWESLIEVISGTH